jgi:hypothetical protein
MVSFIIFVCCMVVRTFLLLMFATLFDSVADGVPVTFDGIGVKISCKRKILTSKHVYKLTKKN